MSILNLTICNMYLDLFLKIARESIKRKKDKKSRYNIKKYYQSYIVPYKQGISENIAKANDFITFLAKANIENRENKIKIEK